MEKKPHERCGRLSGLCGLVFLLGFSLPPLYNLWYATGAGSAANPHGQSGLQRVDSQQRGRSVRLRLRVEKTRGAAWDLEPQVSTLTLHPGKPVRIDYTVHNSTHESGFFRLLPELMPREAAGYLHGFDCLCLIRQHLAGGEQRRLSLRILLSSRLPLHIHDLTLTYRLLEASGAGGDYILAMHALPGPATPF